MDVHAVPATITVAPDAQLADVVFAEDRTSGDLAPFERRSAGSWQPVTARQFAADVRSLAAGTPTLKVKRASVHKDFVAEIDELYR